MPPGQEAACLLVAYDLGCDRRFLLGGRGTSSLSKSKRIPKSPRQNIPKVRGRSRAGVDSRSVNIFHPGSVFDGPGDRKRAPGGRNRGETAGIENIPWPDVWVRRLTTVTDDDDGYGETDGRRQAWEAEGSRGGEAHKHLIPHPPSTRTVEPTGKDHLARAREGYIEVPVYRARRCPHSGRAKG